MSILRSATRQAISALNERRDALVGPEASTEQLVALANELYSVAGLLNAQSRLRRTLGDGATSADSRAALASTVLDGKVGVLTLEVVKAAVSLRWSSPWDLTDDLLETSRPTTRSSPRLRHKAPSTTVEDELFRFERILEGAGELTALLDDYKVDADRRIGLLDRSSSGKVNPLTRAAASRGAAAERKRSILLAHSMTLLPNAGRREGTRSRA